MHLKFKEANFASPKRITFTDGRKLKQMDGLDVEVYDEISYYITMHTHVLSYTA